MEAAVCVYPPKMSASSLVTMVISLPTRVPLLKEDERPDRRDLTMPAGLVRFFRLTEASSFIPLCLARAPIAGE